MQTRAALVPRVYRRSVKAYRPDREAAPCRLRQSSCNPQGRRANPIVSTRCRLLGARAEMSADSVAAAVPGTEPATCTLDCCTLPGLHARAPGWTLPRPCKMPGYPIARCTMLGGFP